MCVVQVGRKTCAANSGGAKTGRCDRNAKDVEIKSILEFQAALKKRTQEIVLLLCFVHAGVFSSNFVLVGLRLGHTKRCAMQARIQTSWGVWYNSVRIKHHINVKNVGPIWECFLPPLNGVLGNSCLLFYLILQCPFGGEATVTLFIEAPIRTEARMALARSFASGF